MPRQADRPLGALPTSVTTWFASQDAEPGLLSNRAVRTHLEPYSPHLWPQVTRLTLLYGIAALRKAYGPGQLSLGDLADVVGAWRALQKVCFCANAPRQPFSRPDPRALCSQRAPRWLSPWRRACLSC